MPSIDSMTLQEKIANTIRCLAIDGVQKANSGHPGMPMGCAEFATVLWSQFLRHNPRNPGWADRDRFVLSAGHGSMLLYSALHLNGYDVGMQDLKSFRQWESRTPGHPERGCLPGVETTTGPLGQGFANGVGMALAEAMLAARFNRHGIRIVDHYTYGIVGDGDLMEGVSAEAASLAGHLKLHKLIYFFDSNQITIEGSTALATSEDVRRRFESYLWHVQEVDGHDFEALDEAIKLAKDFRAAPSLIIGRTHIGKGSPGKQDSASCHGSPLGEEEVLRTKENLGWPQEQFFVPDDVRDFFQGRLEEMEQAEEQWLSSLQALFEKEPRLEEDWTHWQSRSFDGDLLESMPAFRDDDKMATRVASGKVIEAIAPEIRNLVGGSADLAPSNMTMIKGADAIGPGIFSGRNLHFGVREHGMGGVLNGMGLHGGLIPYGGTFLVFADYMRPAIRMAAMSGVPVIYVFTHDSIFVGEDGPTHQPVEHLLSLRAIPNLTVIRPADALETAGAWAVALRRRTGPTALVLSRQKLPVLNGGLADGADLHPQDGVTHGAYILQRERGESPRLILIATGSETHLALEACNLLGEAGRYVRVVSMPSCELFEAQPAGYREAVLPATSTNRLVIEAAVTLGWERYAGATGKVIGIDRFGASAPYTVLAEQFGFTGQHVAEVARTML